MTITGRPGVIELHCNRPPNLIGTRKVVPVSQATMRSLFVRMVAWGQNAKSFDKQVPENRYYGGIPQ